MMLTIFYSIRLSDLLPSSVTANIYGSDSYNLSSSHGEVTIRLDNLCANLVSCHVPFRQDYVFWDVSPLPDKQ